MCGFTALAAAKLLRKGFSDMAKYMNIKTLSVLCWITAGLQIAQSLLQYFFSPIVVLGYASVIIFALTLACCCSCSCILSCHVSRWALRPERTGST